MDKNNLTPMMQQYRRMKKEHPDAILFFRLGDFYEMFYEDAKTASKVLNLAFTSRNNVPMCGIPYHAAESYLARLVKANFKVAICEQMEDPSKVKGIVKREVVRVITPGTVLNESVLDEKSNNYLAAISKAGGVWGLAYLDVSTGELAATEFAYVEDIINELEKLKPSELLIQNSLSNEAEYSRFPQFLKSMEVVLDDWLYEYSSCYSSLLELLEVKSLDGYGAKGMFPAISSAGAAVHYAQDRLNQSLNHIKTFKIYTASQYMMIDTSTQRNLELLENTRGGKEATLVTVLDKTSTSMGSRLLTGWIKQPLVKVDEIISRQNTITEFISNLGITRKISEQLKKMTDMERTLGRISCGYANARDLVSLKNALKLLPGLKEHLKNYSSDYAQAIKADIENFHDVVGLLEESIADSPPVSLKEGGIIKGGFNKELDELREIATSGKDWIARLQAQEIERTGIKSLKIKYNKVFGYYIDITKSNLNMAPDNYIRKQTLVNSERFITPELKEYETKVLNAQAKIEDLEYSIFCEIRDKILVQCGRLKKAACAAALLDLVSAMALLAVENNYTCPVVNEFDLIDIKAGRHPVLENILVDEKFVPNDVFLNCTEDQVLIITGPNMAGKSTYIRQTALLVLMAQMGIYIPCDSSVIGVTDKIFTRVGASDEIAKGQSTFMVEMIETANILNNATSKSLIILDEIGRGTSTFDGISIAWAVAEFLQSSRKAHSKTLFATHYHELTELEELLPGVKNYNIAVKEWNDEIHFVRKIVRGGTDKSYGIHVARLAGLPRSVIERAKEILVVLEENAEENITIQKAKNGSHAQKASDAGQMNLFLSDRHPVEEYFDQIKIDDLTPLQALLKLKELKDLVNKDK
ncbi:MAG: DNA mismatch repair protein MutS [Candidatus Aureabacteria bacterium]|nr:DNA mismatch repair protein MutS [Candidatus Auribacterota bacterium]